MSLQSGNFGVTEFAYVRSVDPIILDNKRSRFDVAFGELAVSVVTASDSVAAGIWQETARQFSSVFVAELEEYIRGLSCVYTVSPDGLLINDIVLQEGRAADGLLISDDDDIDLLTLYQNQASQNASSAALDALADESVPATIDEFSMISNCIIGVQKGTRVRLVKFDSGMVLLPQNAAQSSTPDHTLQ